MTPTRGAQRLFTAIRFFLQPSLGSRI